MITRIKTKFLLILFKFFLNNCFNKELSTNKEGMHIVVVVILNF